MFKSTKQKRWTAWLLTLFMTFSVMSQGLTQTAKAAVGDKVFDLVEITDFHGTLLDSSNNQVGAVLADRIQKVQASNPNTIVIGGGDLYQGSAVSNLLHGVPVQQVLSKIGMEVTALGNHEFDWGLDTITNETMKDASYEIVCANIYNKGTETRKFAPYKIITKDGVRIAFIGAITEETPSIVLPAYIDNYDVRPVAAEVNKVAKEIKDGNLADVIIPIIHEGNDGDNKTTGKIVDIANALTGVNAVFGGHSHTELHFTATNGLPVYIAKSNGKGYIDAKMTVSADKKVSFLAPSTADYKALDNADGYKTANPIVNAEAKKIIDDAVAQVAPITDVVIGKTSKVLDRVQQKLPGNPSGTSGSSFLGNWAADATRAAVNAEVGLQNNGGLRIDIPVGNITVGTMWQFMPFDNTVYKLSMNKAQLKAVLEQAVQDGGKGIQVSGIKFTYDSTEPTGKRIIDITRENGNVISDSEPIIVAAPDFLATGGDGFTALKTAGGSDPANDSHILIRDALINNIKAHKDEDPSIITSSANRITNLAKVVSVVATSDVHGNVYNYDYATGKAPSVGQGLAKVSTYVNGLRATNPNTMLVDNGDTIQGTPLVYYYNMLDQTAEYPMMKVMGAMGYDSWTLGNHEFNYGLPTLNRIMNDAKSEGINVLSANIYKADNTNFVGPYIMKTMSVNGRNFKVAVIGLTTKTVPSWEDAAHYSGLKFNDLVDEAKKWVPIVKGKGADVVIVTAHTGEESAADVIPENQAKALAAKVPGIDVVVAGHAHSVLPDLKGNPNNKENLLGSVKNEVTGKDVLITEPGKWANYISQVDINVNRNGEFRSVATKVVAMDNNVKEDPAILALAQPYQDKTLEYVKTKLGTSTGEFTGAGQTTQATAIMELINKVQMEGAKTQLSIAAPLSSTAYIPKGDVTIQNTMSVYVFENFLYGVKMTGKQLKDWMEYSVRYYKQLSDPNANIEKDPVLNIADYNLDQLYGATYDIDLTQPACTIDKATGRVVSGNRIKNLKFNGKLVKDTDVFTVAINNYRYNGGGGFMAAAGLSNTDPSIVTYDSAKALGDDGQVRSMMMQYIKNHGTISPDCSNNWKISKTAVTQEVEKTPVVVDNNTAAVVTAVNNAAAGETVTVDVTNNSVVSKDVFTAIKGKDVNVTFQKDGITWTFNGKDIDPSLIKDIDLSLKTVSADLKAKEAAKVKAIVGKDVAIVPFSFTYDGKLPGKATVKVFIGKDWANTTVYVNRYYADKNTYEIVAEATVDADGYMTFTTDHCSDYFVMAKSAAPNLPKTGSPIDMNVVVGMGSLVALLGAALFISGRRREDNDIAS